ncbi:MAG: hypothetical protein COV96_01195 [Candidatus Zambryskibacteria bacterium CG11_big_fil_rev_8_21_14_0_20_42_18]|uniref:Uncharacterized protein n=1 Tax=Candidatus Zambryskibacteria bacterium CG_4_9_14_3_um_filter_42_15 TaxID=1975112 RepID=A0A2M7WSW8_9BACT|nr:MAG: hypothetical protein COV96_01195 [Candidatus Zambryskibacteria bacterium CG11_big_fil_rev_8_21_14_0_20_42_18]PJA33101.1 MAG: hypothetical protein CO185_00440 [Candidatus Zambryskibacteria bacterium CG_4_9_14_3_um_filter_42_15]
MINITTREKIMFGVYVLYTIRKLKTPLVTESLVFLILATSLFYFVSVPSFFSNMFESGNFGSYFIMAFSHTDFLVQSALILAFVTVLLFVRNFTLHAILKNRLA